MNARVFICGALLVFAAGCAGELPPPAPGLDNPASDKAAEAPPPAASNTLAIPGDQLPPKPNEDPMPMMPGMKDMKGMQHGGEQ